MLAPSPRPSDEIASRGRGAKSPKARGRAMTLRALVGALYFMVAGGPYGIEDLVDATGFRGAIAVLLAMPIVWCVPTAFLVGELAAALPEEGGYYAWVRRALGPFWGYQEAWLSLAASLFDMALYPTLFVLYLSRLWPAAASAPSAIGVGVIASAAAWNLAGAELVGEGAALMTALLLAPFGVLAVLAVTASFHTAPGLSHAMAHPSDYAAGALVAMWNTMGWDNASTIAGEVDNPQRIYPRAVFTSVFLVALTYVVPVAAMAVAGADPSGWETGAWVDAGRGYGGRALALAILVGGLVSAFGMCSALCLSYSRLPAVLALDGYLPRVFARQSRRTGVPWVSVLACSFAWTLMLGLSFDRLLSLDILLYGASLILEFVALVVLRIREPTLPRPLRVPGGTAGAVLLALPPIGLIGFALVKTASEHVGPVNSLLFGAGVVLLGPLAYLATSLTSRAERRRRCETR
jgi:amino acid transporter